MVFTLKNTLKKKKKMVEILNNSIKIDYFLYENSNFFQNYPHFFCFFFFILVEIIFIIPLCLLHTFIHGDA